MRVRYVQLDNVLQVDAVVREVEHAPVQEREGRRSSLGREHWCGGPSSPGRRTGAGRGKPLVLRVSRGGGAFSSSGRKRTLQD